MCQPELWVWLGIFGGYCVNFKPLGVFIVFYIYWSWLFWIGRGRGGGGGGGASKSRRLVCRVKAVIGFSGKVCDRTGSFSIRCQFLCNRHVIFGS